MFNAHQNLNYLKFITNELKDFDHQEDSLSFESEEFDGTPSNKDSLGRRFRNILNIEFSVAANTSQTNTSGGTMNLSGDLSTSNADISMTSNGRGNL